MRIIIDDYSLNQFEEIHSLEELALKIQSQLQDLDVLFIHVNLSFQKLRRISQTGIELLIWLRLIGVMNHCVLYSFENLHSLINRQPKHLLATSIGTTFIQLPVDLKSIDFENLKNNKANKENLLNCLRSAFDFSEFRHREANWWGLKCLWDVHKIATKGIFNEEYPVFLSNKLKDINNAVADFVYGIEDYRLKEYIENYEKGIEIELNGLIENLNILLLKIDKGETDKLDVHHILQKIGLFIKNKYENILRFLSNTTKEYMEISLEIDDQKLEENLWNTELLTISGNIENYQNNKEYLINEINRKKLMLNNVYEALNHEFFKNYSLPHIDKRIRVLMIDDQAENGWATIFEHIVFNGESTNFKYLAPSPTYINKIDKLYEGKNIDGTLKEDCVKYIISNYQPTLVLLDVRLFDESNKSIDIENISGKNLLEKIRNDFKCLPIIMTSASNKIWTYEKLINRGADAYWIKEGIDEQRTAEDTIENYRRFLELISITSSYKFQSLLKVSDEIERLKTIENFWWEKFEWYKNADEIVFVPAVTECKKEDVFSILDEILILFRTYIHQTELKSVYYPYEGREWFYVSLIIQHAGKLVELVHEFDKLDEGFNNAKTICSFEKYSRNDYFGKLIYNSRNKSSHINKSTKIDWKRLISTLDTIIDWLTTTPKKD